MLMHTVSGWICLTGSFRQLLWKKIRLRQLEHSPKSCPYDAIWTLLEDFIQQAKRLLPFSVFCHTSQDLAARHNTWTKPGLSTVRKIRAKPSSRILISLKWVFFAFRWGTHETNQTKTPRIKMSWAQGTSQMASNEWSACCHANPLHAARIALKHIPSSIKVNGHSWFLSNQEAGQAYVWLGLLQKSYKHATPGHPLQCLVIQ